MSDPPRAPRRREVMALKPPAELQALRAVVYPDPDPDPTYLEHEGLEERRRDYQRGRFHFVAVRVEADVAIAGTVQLLVSPGLTSIESDVEDAELGDVIAEEWEILRKVLKTVGVPTDRLPRAVEKIERRE